MIIYDIFHSKEIIYAFKSNHSKKIETKLFIIYIFLSNQWMMNNPNDKTIDNITKIF
jgi:hypothetical protein